MDKKGSKIAVIGAGVVGLSVAKILQDRLPEAKVTVIADKFEQDTVSCVAAGIFRPGPSFKGPTKDITKRWIVDSWNYWQEILKTSDAFEAGIMQFDTYIFSKDNYQVTRNHLIEDLVPVYRPVDERELKMCGEGWKYGSYFSTLKIGCEKHLPWLKKIITSNGGEIIVKSIDNFTSLSGYDLIFNCTGLGAKTLCEDHDLVPIRGQVIKARAPWLKTAFYGDYDTYVIPGLDGVATLGGTRQYDSYNKQIDKYDAASILERCCELVPGLKKAEVVEHRVGLRPHRVPVRVEGELVSGVRVVHCYGHGGYGVMCAPGTAIHAIEIGLNMLNNVQSKL